MTSLDVPRQPGRRARDNTYWCNCAHACYGMMQQVARSTYYRHRDAAQVPLQQSGMGGPSSIDSSDESQSPSPPSAQNEGAFDLNASSTMDTSGFGLASPSSEAAQRDFSPTRDSDNEEQDSDEEMFSPSEDDELESGDSSASDSSDRIRIKITLDTLKETQTFIEDLRHATLDNSGMSDPALARLRDPPLNASSLVADKDLRLSLDLFMASTNGSQKTYAKSRAAVQRRYPGADILSHYQVRNRLETLSGVSPILHDRCPNTCMAYTGQFSSLTSCPTCAEPRYDRVSGKRKAVPRAQFHTYPLGPQLQALYASPESAKNMAYRRERTAKLKSRVRQPDGTYNIETYEDYIDGSDYLDAVEQGKIGENEVLVVLSIDGAQLYEKKKSDCWMYIWIVYELGPDQRYKVANVLPGGIIPGPNKPQNVDSFTFPGLYHLSALQKEGLPVYDAYRKERSVKTPFFVFGTADGPGLVYLNGGAGHMGYYGCRLSCPTPGRRVGQSTNYYPAILRPSGDLPRGSGHEDIDVQTMSVASFSNYQERLAVLLAVQNRHQYIGARFSTGLTKQSLFSGLRLDRMFPVPTCFPSDMMHLICLNLTDLLLALWRGTIEVGEGDSKDTWDWVVLVGDAWKDHGKAVEDLRQYLLSTIERPPRNPYKAINSGYKAQEWLIYVFGYCPALLHGLLPDKYWKNFCKLVAAVRLLSLRSITVSQVLQAHVWLLEFVQEFEELYVQRKQSRIHFVRQCVHNLIHLAPETFRTGPQGNHAQWTMERMIGSLGEEIKQPSKPYENLSQRGILRAQINAISHMCPDLASTSPSSSASSSSRTASGYTLLSPCDSARRSILDDERDALTTYLADHTEYRGGTPDKLVRWGRLELPNGMQVRTAWKEKARAVDQFKRTARMVTILSDECNPTVGEVLYFFQFVYREETHSLAMVAVGASRDEQLYSDSFGTVNTTAVHVQGTVRDVRVVKVTEIRASISVLKMPEHARVSNNSWFIMEEMGLSVLNWFSSRDGDEEHDDEDEDRN